MPKEGLNNIACRRDAEIAEFFLFDYYRFSSASSASPRQKFI